MASKTYTARELLRLRNALVRKDLFDQLYRRLRSDDELGEIFRLPIERSPLPLISEEPSNDSGDSDDHESVQNRVSRQLDGTDSEWKYRGRTKSEQAETQPIPAPTGLAAQKDEGFQRFYKAVVSPTHVRVTAGGRIVPNTRGSSSPTAKWVRDRLPDDSGANPQSPSRDPPEQSNAIVNANYNVSANANVNVNGNPNVNGNSNASANENANRNTNTNANANAVQTSGFSALQTMYPVSGVFAPGVHHAPNQIPVMPWQLGLNFNPAFSISPHVLGQPLPTTAAQNVPRNEAQGDAVGSENQGPVRLSPPDQFDPNRPFLINGQLVWPPFYHCSMPGFPAIPPPMLGQTMAHHRFGMAPIMLPQPPRPVPPEQPQQPNVAVPLPFQPAHMSHIRPPISSIRPSEITRRQMEQLRGSLRYYEDQLQYNRHQIDEQDMENRAQIVRQQLRLFRRNLQTQLEFEAVHYPRPGVDDEDSDDSSSTTSSEASVESTSPPAGDSESAHGGDGTSIPRDDTSIVRATNSQTLQGQSSDSLGDHSDSNNSAPAFSTLGASVDSPTRARTLRKVSSLPVTAALAPPFQPRADAATSLSAVAISGQGSDEKSLKNASSSSTNYSDTINEESLGSEPYLVGLLPPNIRPEDAKDTDYLYSRELTGDELRARHMYWGKAPRHLQSGLPKFDGKDFYPPSPTKGNLTSISSTFGNQTESSCTTDNRRAAARESDPFRAPIQQGAIGVLTSGREAQYEHGGGERLLGSVTAESLRPRILRPSAKSAGNIRIMVSSSEGPSTASTSGTSPQSNDDGNDDDDKNLIFKGRNALARNGTKSHNEIWQSMLRRGTSSANAVQGTVSSMTAQGVLPQYAGHATASLTPAITNASVSPRGSATRAGGRREAGSANPTVEKQVENRPPGENKLTVRRGNPTCTQPATAI